jgi:hypothetical protein
LELVEAVSAPAAPYEVPMASLMMCRPMNAAALGFWWLGDCTGRVELAEEDGRRYPRFTTSDDATAVLVRCVD